MADLDSTQVLLESTITTPEMIDSVYQDESEDEVFFGKVSSKEMTIPTNRPMLVARVPALHLAILPPTWCAHGWRRAAGGIEYLVPS